ncbi:MAG: mechanosensitive ion channel family protein, partial [Microcoleaceae cyanobacterium]
IHGLLGQFWQKYLRRKYLRFLDANQVDATVKNTQGLERLFNLLLLIIRIILWVATALFISQQFPATYTISKYLTDVLINMFTKPIVKLGNSRYSIPGLITLLFLIWGMLLTVGSLTNILKLRILTITKMSRGEQEAIAVIIKYFLITLGTIFLLQIWGIDLSSITIIASAFGVGIGLGFQDIARNFASGLILLFERPMQVGDFVEIGIYKGVVEKIGARGTVIKNADRVSIIVPNSRFLQNELINWTNDDAIIGMRLNLAVPELHDPIKVKELLLQATQQVAQVLKQPPPVVLFQGFADQSLNFELLVWIIHPSQQGMVKSDLFFAIDRIFRAENILPPFIAPIPPDQSI